MKSILPSVRKAFEINSDPSTYGTFAEIGAGQEVARHFFVAGQASGTIAKAISAYDTVFSDEIYGKEASGRYVCQSRARKMLDHEFDLLVDRLDHLKDKKRFFVFADTVATNRRHGWMAVRFQFEPNAPASDVVLHVNMKDNTRLQQSEALGHLGVNLIHSCFFKNQNPKEFISSLTDNLSIGRVEIDMIRFSGPAFEIYDNRLMCLELIEQKLTPAVMFNAQGDVIQPGDLIYDQALFVQRGSFRPVTNVNLQISESGLKQFAIDFDLNVPSNDKPKATSNANETVNPTPVSLFEITMKQLHHNVQSDDLDRKDFLDRVDCLSKIGMPVIISDFVHFYELKEYLRTLTEKPLAMVIGGNQLDYFFNDETHETLDGGLFESAARLFDLKTCVYVYPYKTDQICANTKSFFPPDKISHLFQYLLNNGKLKDLSDCDEVNISKLASEVRKMLSENNPAWEKSVPAKVVDHIKKHNLFR